MAEPNSQTAQLLHQLAAEAEQGILVTSDIRRSAASTETAKPHSVDANLA
jgi:hypothetical protein